MIDARAERLAPGRGEDVVFSSLAPFRAVRLAPFGADEPFSLQLVEERVDRPLLPGEGAVGLFVDLANDVVAIVGALFEDAQHHQRGRSADQFLICREHVFSFRGQYT